MANKFTRAVGNPEGKLGIILVAVAIILVLASNLFDVLATGTALQGTLVQQKTVLENNGKVEAQLEALANGTQGLAAQGNPNAREIVEMLKQNGVSINPPKPGQP